MYREHSLASLGLPTKRNFHIGQLTTLLSQSCCAAITVPYDDLCILQKHHVLNVDIRSAYSLCPFRTAPWIYWINVTFHFLMIFVSPWPKPRLQNDLNSGGSSWQLRTLIFFIFTDRLMSRPCPLCAKIISNKSNLQKHMKIVHSNQCKQQRCLLCERVFKNKYSLKAHVYTYHRETLAK